MRQKDNTNTQQTRYTREKTQWYTYVPFATESISKLKQHAFFTTTDYGLSYVQRVGHVRYVMTGIVVCKVHVLTVPR